MEIEIFTFVVKGSTKLTVSTDWQEQIQIGSIKYRSIISDPDRLVGWLVVLKINVDLAIFQQYLDLEAGDNQSLKIQVARPGIEPRSSCSASQELNHSATAAPQIQTGNMVLHTYISREMETFHLYNTNQSK